ncbi:MAG TPA: glycosyltransferase family 1 protein [Bryobacteraceae bacterium]|nr:glycosyltransferase family 1 protein [Bryobacteraceae bacterium]
MNVLAYVHMRNIHGSTGAGRVARQLTEHVARRTGVNVHILADQADHKAVVDKVGAPWTTFQYHLFLKDTSYQQARWLALHNPVAEKYWPEVDIVHCTGESYVPTSHCKLIVTAHDAAYFDPGAHPNNFATMKQRLKWRFLYATLSRTADLFHTVSQFSAERLGWAFPSIRSRLRVIHNAVPERFFEPAGPNGDAFLERTGLNNRRYILVPGGLHYRKNADLVLQAWPVLSKRVPDVTLVVSGHCDPQYAARAAALDKSIFFTGFVNDDELCALYHDAQAVWFPSRYEGFGMPVLEAMTCGAPVVASNSTSIPEIAGDAALLVNPQSVDENVQALETVVGNSRLQASLRERGRSQALKFRWSSSAAQLHELYSSVM